MSNKIDFYRQFFKFNWAMSCEDENQNMLRQHFDWDEMLSQSLNKSNCKYGLLEVPVSMPNGRMRYCKKKQEAEATNMFMKHHVKDKDSQFISISEIFKNFGFLRTF